MMQRDNSPPVYSIGKGSRDNIIRKDRDLMNVGPFNYTKTFADTKQAARYSMGQKLDSSIMNKYLFAPAPNIYEPTPALTKEHSP